MDDISDFFKSGFLSLHKNTIGKSYQQKTLKDRMNNFNSLRRETRNTLIFQKRQIDENMTPISTPEPTKLVKRFTEKKEAKKPNKRLEMLNKWKADKEKRKQEEQKKAKPLFKVCHVPVEVGLPNLENINKEIKGKLIKSTPIKSQFAPPNHKFHAPKNIKPINLSSSSKNTSLQTESKIRQPKSKLMEKNKITSNQNPIISQRTTRAATARIEQATKLNEKQGSTLTNKSRIRTEVNRINSRQNNLPSQKQKIMPLSPKVEMKNMLKSKLKEPPQKTTSIINTRKKLQFQDSFVNKISSNKADVKSNSPKKNRKDEKITKKKTLTVQLSSIDLDKINNLPEEKSKVEETKKTPRKNKKSFRGKSECNEDVVAESKKSPRMVKQPKLKDQNSFETTNKSTLLSSMPTRKTPKKSIGWNVIEIVDSDDEVFSEEINNKSPKKINKKYNKTPRKGKKNEEVADVTSETLTSEDNHVRDLSSAYEDLHKTPVKRNLKSDSETEQSKAKSRKSTLDSATGSTSPDYPIECMTLNTSHTPIKNAAQEVCPVYISPFVTVSRGKNSARKEYKVRQSTGDSNGNTPEFGKDISNNISPKAGADYFTKKLNNEIIRIEGICDKWSMYKDQSDFPEEANDMIDVAIGQSKLLISKKFKQFQSLIDQCKTCQYKEKAITCKDLHGFWDMIYMQVEDVNKRFNNLDVLKANNWQEVIPEKKPVVKRSRGRPKKASASSTLKNLIKAARSMKKPNDEKQNMEVVTQSSDGLSDKNNLINPPITERKTLTPRFSSARTSLRGSLLAGQAKSRISSSPGLMMMKISQAIKFGDGLTPSKSILKTDLTKSANRVTKSVLFRDDLEDNVDEHFSSPKTVLSKNVENSVNKENDYNEMNLISFSPVTPTRRSRRLTKIN